MNPFPMILSSPSGGGKTTIARMLLKRREDVGYSISCTTRSPRNGEENGRDYHFLSVDEFRERRSRGEFAESAEVHGNFYGTLRSEIERVFGTGRHVVMDIDVQGARQFVAAYPESVLVFLLPPSAEVLLGRLTGRQTESPEALHRRLTGARDELAAVGSYQYVVVNDDLEVAYAQVASIVDAETVRHRRVPLLEDRVRLLVDGLDREITKYARAG
ncbi:MAG: guanylate kinase [Gemmatimonadaceae bacterium]|nr:guanylate kinase [Gemmatimonadaceae bacterium]